MIDCPQTIIHTNRLIISQQINSNSELFKWFTTSKITFLMLNIFILSVLFVCWKCNFPLSSHVCPLVSWSVRWSLGLAGAGSYTLMLHASVQHFSLFLFWIVWSLSWHKFIINVFNTVLKWYENFKMQHSKICINIL